MALEKLCPDPENLVIAAEHVQLMVADPYRLFPKIRHAGAIFLGKNTPEAMGDYIAGPNHVLPTSGTARFASGLSVYDFLKRTTYVSLPQSALEALGPAAITLAEAETYLRLLAGRRHKVFTSVAVCAPDGRIASRVVTSVVGFARLDDGQIRDYLASGEWEGKAGGYAIQGRAAAFIDFVSGSYSAVVGLPLYETSALLRGLGFR